MDNAFIAKNLGKKINDRSAIIAVVGLGYVGLPLAVEKCKVGFKVIGIDQNPKRAKQVNDGQNYIKDVADNDLSDIVSKGLLKATTEFSTLREADVIVICVPTPLTVNKEPDISYIQSVSDEIANYLKPGQLVVLESTTYPGTTEEVILPKLEKNGLKVGRDFFLAFSPERVDPGNKRYTTKNTYKVVGGVTENCLQAALAFYNQTIVKTIPVSSPRVAEMTKVFENVFRSVNIALVNELAQLCNKMNIDVYEVIDAASTKNFGFMAFYPGPGVGGHCIPLDPYYLSWKSKEYDQHTRFIELAGEINENMPYYVVHKMIETLNTLGKPLKGSRIVQLGIAYKKDIDDWRESPAIKILEILEGYGAQVTVVDSYVDCFQDHSGKKTWKTTPYSAAAIKGSDLVLVTTDHTDVPYDEVIKLAPAIVDTRNATKQALEKADPQLRMKVVKLSTTLNEHYRARSAQYT